MDIPNLSSPEQNLTPITPVKTTSKIFDLRIVAVMAVVGIVFGYVFSTFSKNTSLPSTLTGSNSSGIIPIESVTSSKDLVVGKVYGDSEKAFKDIATGVIEKGSINGEGTHILNREGGASQRASLTSSAVDLDLFVGKKVEVKGQTNASTKTSWLLDVGSVKILE
jgi:hypothetical protein